MPATSRAQQQAAGAALSAKRGETNPSELYGAAREMYDSMSEEELEDLASTTGADLPERADEAEAEDWPAGSGAVDPGVPYESEQRLTRPASGERRPSRARKPASTARRAATTPARKAATTPARKTASGARTTGAASGARTTAARKALGAKKVATKASRGRAATAKASRKPAAQPKSAAARKTTTSAKKSPARKGAARGTSAAARKSSATRKPAPRKR